MTDAFFYGNRLKKSNAFKEWFETPSRLFLNEFMKSTLKRHWPSDPFQQTTLTFDQFPFAPKNFKPFHFNQVPNKKISIKSKISCYLSRLDICIV